MGRCLGGVGSLAPHFRDLLPSGPSGLGLQWGVRAVAGPACSEKPAPPLPAKFLLEDPFCIFSPFFLSFFSLSLPSFLSFSSSFFLFICFFLFLFFLLFFSPAIHFFLHFLPRDLFSFFIHWFPSFPSSLFPYYTSYSLLFSLLLKAFLPP